MKQHTFETLRAPSWQAFEQQLKHVRAGYRLSDGDAAGFALEYRHLARDLSVARSRGYSQRLVRYLNDLVVAGHTLIYVRRSGYAGTVRDFLVWGFPAAVRSAWAYLAVAAVLFAGSLLAMLLTVLVAPEWAYTVMSADQTAALEAMYDPEAVVLGRERASDSDFAMFGFYIMNNIGISFQLFASGLLLGLGSAGYLLFNGIYIGAVAAHLINAGFAETFFAFVAGHSALELTAIVIAGAAGLMLGYGLLAPSALPRVQSLQLAARRAVPLVIGAALMLLIAAFVEAFWSSIGGLPAVVKYVVGATLWLLVLGYLVGAGRRLHPDQR